MDKNRECLLLHGWGTSNMIWQDFADHLKGFNRVSMPCLYQAANEAKDSKLESIAGVISEKIKTDCVVVAWSLGGLVATRLVNLTDKIRAMVFIASPPCFINKEGWSNVIDETSIDDLQNKLSNNTIKTLEYFAGLIAHGDISIIETNKLTRSNLADEKNKNILSSWLIQMQETDQRNDFAAINLPIQIILGENDSFINPEIENQLKQLNPGIESEVIKNCGHAPFISKQKETIKIINEFINKHS